MGKEGRFSARFWAWILERQRSGLEPPQRLRHKRVETRFLAVSNCAIHKMTEESIKVMNSQTSNKEGKCIKLKSTSNLHPLFFLQIIMYVIFGYFFKCNFLFPISKIVVIQLVILPFSVHNITCFRIFRKHVHEHLEGVECYDPVIGHWVWYQ